MSIKRRLTIRYILQLALAGLFILILAALTMYWMFQKLTDIEIKRDFASVGLSMLISTSTIGPDGLQFDPELLNQVKASGSWLQSMDEQGRITKSYFTPGDVPSSYAPGELIDYWNGAKPFPYQLSLWMEEKEGRNYTLIYGSRSRAYSMLQEIVTQYETQGSPVISSGTALKLPEQLTANIDRLRAWVQLLDNKGEEIASYNKPGDALTRYNAQELALRTQYRDNYGIELASHYDAETGQTWVLNIPEPDNIGRSSPSFLLSPELKVLLIGLAALISTSFIVFVLLSLWYGHRFGAPVLYMMNWIQALGRGNYGEPPDRKGTRKRSSGKRNGWDRRYRVYSEVLDSLESLSSTLRRDEEHRRIADRTREEWIAGVTHDLKTPLSSIMGYAHMLEAESYSWTETEVRQFAHTITEKSTYMDVLINDLSLTYRLRNGDIPCENTQVEMSAYLQEVVNRAASNPAYGGDRVICQTSDNPHIAFIHPAWFERVVENLVANALLHNPQETVLVVTLHTRSGGGMAVTFSDNGNGMDAETADILFERYYRGTSTDISPAGSGLGMAITKELVQAMGGRIEVKTKPGKGTNISLIWD
ncbi:HAMP domain-containing histidine kinase [Paenibacillus oenotherae]|uniref:histidine kinase n=1 Tax=Paenibacillus oenotherae TaxID=1435645 RepID=A0ABS7D491_9BACL|nr:HAMP domain-containing sensor histidine kinase [Paenibacillus oenotherae]MBW7474705.1 HAMP domain-containing histidine kinase [Paenibacillus oenotherae]